MLSMSLIMREVCDILDEHGVIYERFNDGMYAWEITFPNGERTCRWVKIQLSNGWLNSFLGY